MHRKLTDELLGERNRVFLGVVPAGLFNAMTWACYAKS